MTKFYEKLIGVRPIKQYKEEWKLYKKVIHKEFTWHIIGLILLGIAFYLFPTVNIYIGIALAYFGATLLIKFGEYRGYNECLYSLENE